MNILKLTYLFEEDKEVDLVSQFYFFFLDNRQINLTFDWSNNSSYDHCLNCMIEDVGQFINLAYVHHFLTNKLNMSCN
jgi:hypothetical protein